MLGLVVSFIAFVVASFFIRRYLDEMEIPRTMTRAIVIFILALGVSYVNRHLARMAVNYLTTYPSIHDFSMYMVRQRTVRGNAEEDCDCR